MKYFLADQKKQKHYEYKDLESLEKAIDALGDAYDSHYQSYRLSLEVDSMGLVTIFDKSIEDLEEELIIDNIPVGLSDEQKSEALDDIYSRLTFEADGNYYYITLAPEGTKPVDDSELSL
jgi:hypothetical protein